MKKIAIFASGSGSNAQRLMEHFKNHSEIEISLILTNNPDAYVLQRADNFEVPTHIFSEAELNEPNGVLKLLQNMKIEFIVLAGFLKLIPQFIIESYEKKIVNLHPALLPKFGGKGMYGIKVHQAVLSNKEQESGITIHYVDKIYDQGEIIFQAKVEVEKKDTPEILSYKIHQLEHQYLPKVIEEIILKK